ncbi:hypothetical protein KR52_08550 [Synechococcus sp. KORDI-52]|uniref:hypothetical protein n=1 Tax=Synechococcus sp. KORDI-52 TaxID=585425 RepID=UPI0004E08A4B|nr:hypothetical protein [Synechococcus sp. KORDI-52]AII49191.1 hypothetical protein KR52_08550 [Synechococcus sp. KORDI-52]
MKEELSTCQLLIVLVLEIQAVVQEVMQAFADAEIFKSSLGTGKGDVVPALQSLSDSASAAPHTRPRSLG